MMGIAEESLDMVLSTDVGLKLCSYEDPVKKVNGRLRWGTTPFLYRD